MSYIQIPADIPVLPGCRFDGQRFHPTNTDGSSLYTIEKTIRTPFGSVQVYEPSYQGVQVEPAMTNKCTCRKVNPTDTTNLIKSGDAAAVLSVVDDAAALTAAGLIGICTSGKVYKLDNSAGVGVSRVRIIGSVTNTNAHSAGVYCRGTTGTACYLGWDYSGSYEFKNITLTEDYVFYSGLNKTPPTTTAQVSFSAAAGAVLYFIMPELVESAFLTSLIMPNPTEDGLATVTRPADNISFATPSWLLAHPNDLGIRMRVIPGAAQNAKHLLSIYTDANNEISLILNTADVTFRKRAVGTSTDTAATYSHAADTLFEAILYSSYALGTGIAVRSHNGSVWSDWSAWTAADSAGAKANTVLTATARIGAQTASAGHVYAEFPLTQLVRLPASLTSAEAIQAWMEALCE